MWPAPREEGKRKRVRGMGTLIITVVYGGLEIEETPLVDSLRRVGYGGEFQVVREEGDIGNRRRMFSYARALRQAGPGIDRVILTDARDVLFQGDPGEIRHGELDLFLEAEGQTLGSCPINQRNYIDEYGEAAFEAVKDRPISCAGVVIGTRAGVERYLDLFCAEVERCRPHVPWSQPLHNRLLWSGALDPVRVIPNEQGAVYTVGHCPELRVREHLVLNRAGRVPYIVHQFDRHLAIL